MATVTKPVALNESLNTTENTPRNIADVLAEELLIIAKNLKPDADDIPYDNTASGLSSNNVQDAIDEVVNDVNGKVSKSGDTMSGNLTVDRQDGTTSSVGITEIAIGNNKGQGVDKNSRGFLYLFSTIGKWVRVRNDNGTANRDIYLPDKSGTIALTSDLLPTGTVLEIYSNNNTEALDSQIEKELTAPKNGKIWVDLRDYVSVSGTYREFILKVNNSIVKSFSGDDFYQYAVTEGQVITIIHQRNACGKIRVYYVVS